MAVRVFLSVRVFQRRKYTSIKSAQRYKKYLIYANDLHFYERLFVIFYIFMNDFCVMIYTFMNDIL